MVFNSLTFVLFFAVVLSLDRGRIPWRVRKLNLLLASYVFYAAWSPPFVLLIWLSTVVDWLVARQLRKTAVLSGRRFLLGVSLVVNLGLLGYFKYGNFLVEQFQFLLATLGVHFRPPELSIVLPVGISFYTFQTLSYTIDVYRGRTELDPSLLDFALFVTFFPQLVAGPIVRAVDFLPQLAIPRRASMEQIGRGLSLLTFGLFEKIVLSDAILAPVADAVYAAPADVSWTQAWIGTFAFSGQIFFDFAGYSTCAIGAALCLGFALPANFRAPYAAMGFSDFWQRWHISLSSWLRDYLYIPLGGNRSGTARTYVNLSITMLLGGLWHGASWRFVVWGAIHGAYLTVERIFRSCRSSEPSESIIAKLATVLLTYLLVCVTWVFFRARSFDDAFQLLSTMFAGGASAIHIDPSKVGLALAVIIVMIAAHWLFRAYPPDGFSVALPWWARSPVLASLIVAIVLAPGENRAFIYFQF